jgi:hypothetical protein
MKAKLGFCELLERSAEVLEAQAVSIRESCTYKGRWDGGQIGRNARAECTELRNLAKQLRKSAKYHKPNPLGGPAVIFDACANAIRAGDSIKDAMDDYGLKFKKGAA